MRNLEKWIWLDDEIYGNYQTTIFHPDACLPQQRESSGNYCVAEFKRKYVFPQKVKAIQLRFSGDTSFDVWLNGELLATGPNAVGGDFFLNNDKCRDWYYATEMNLTPDSEELNFYARVKMMPVQLNEYSKGHGGFMLTGYITYEDETIDIITTDSSWLCRKNSKYTAPYRYDDSMMLDDFTYAKEIQNIWHTQTAPVPPRTEEIIGTETIEISGNTRKEVVINYEKVYAAFMHMKIRTSGRLKVLAICFEKEEEIGIEEFLFCHDTEYRGIQMHSIGGYKLIVENQSNEKAEICMDAIATCYPAEECAMIKTSDDRLDKILELCRHALKYCRQTMHLDSPKHCEPLACTGDYYIETLMTAFSFGDMQLAKMDVIRTAELLRHQEGRMFHTTYSLIWVLMLYDVYMFTGDSSLLSDCSISLIMLLKRFESYVGENGLIENPPDYMFVDWLDVDGYAIHHPPKNLGQSVLNMFYFGALDTAVKIYAVLDMKAMQHKYSAMAEKLKKNINTLLFDKNKKLYFEGLTTPTEDSLISGWLPQSNGKKYFRKHANILAAYFGICDKTTAVSILERVMEDDSLGECQPYFMHFLFEAVYKNDLREKYTMALLENWKNALKICDKGLMEGFILPEGYGFDISHAWGGSPLYSIPKALLGFEMVEAGFKKIKLQPHLLGLDEAWIEMLTPYGKITCYQKQGEEPDIKIPEAIERK